MATALIGLYIAYVVPGLSTSSASMFSLGLVVGMLAAEVAALVSFNLWLKLVFPASLLTACFAAQWLFRILLQHPAAKPAATSTKPSDRMMALALQGQGQLDMAFERFQRTAMNATVANDLYCLAMEYERQHRLGEAVGVFQYIAKFEPDFKDVKTRLSTAVDAAEPTQSTASATAPKTTASGQPIPAQASFFGRYRIEKTIGKGAMGMVYLGTDPKIGRQVALKTMALSQEFEGLELADARERFFREAKAAGRLQHPGIVTIFDVGEQGNLAFIAMEYITGQDLQAFSRPGSLMPVPQVASIVARVAQALAYAQRQQVIHRDIKPGNVMYDVNTDTVKVTDFGIARITDGNKTRTGMVLGSPSYMAPEQLAGLTLDGRSDLYALGAMFFQLLTGTLPFKANNLTDLMAKIAHEPAPDVRQFRSELSEDLARIVARLMEKLPKNRYQDGETLARDLTSYAKRVQSLVASAKDSELPREETVANHTLDLEL
jgi:serine/threonine-protein kinase